MGTSGTECADTCDAFGGMTVQLDAADCHEPLPQALAKPGDPRDTTTPAAMMRTLGKLLLDDVLSPSSRDQFAAWLVANRTGDRRLRAGLPTNWTIGEKTGTSGHGEAGDVGFMRPPKSQTILASVYIAEAPKPVKELEPIFAEVGKLIAGMA